MFQTVQIANTQFPAVSFFHLKIPQKEAAREVTINNLSDFTTHDILAGIVKEFGRVDDVKIYNHSRKNHDAIAKVNMTAD